MSEGSAPSRQIVLPDPFLRSAREKTLYASFSGGPDSTALVLLLAGSGLPFQAVHFTHGIRDDETGRREWMFCRSFCEERGIPVQRRELDVPAARRTGEGLEAAARRCRLDAWRELTGGEDSAAVITAHHADDVCENLLLRLFRGGNVSSLTALRPESLVNGIRFLRPLLAYSKRELKDFLIRNGISGWAEDATNAEDAAARNFIRNRLLPLVGERLPFAPGGIRASSFALADDASFLEDAAASAARGDLTDAAYWKTLHPAVRIRVMRVFLSEAAGCSVIPDRRLMERFGFLLDQPATRRKRKMPVSGTSLSLVRTGNRIGLE